MRFLARRFIGQSDKKITIPPGCEDASDVQIGW